MIGADVVVRIIEVKGGQVKLGIDAPQKTSVHREEVYRRICDENLRAAAHAPTQLDSVVQAVSARQKRSQGGNDE